MGLAAAAAGRFSLHLYTIARHIIRGRDQVQNYNLQQASKSQKDIHFAMQVRAIDVDLPIHLKISFVSHLFRPQSGWSRSHTFIPLYFFGETPYFFGIGLWFWHPVLSQLSCVPPNVFYKHSWTGHILSLLMLILLSWVSGGAFNATMPFMNADPI